MKRAVVLIVALLLISGASGADRNIAWCGNSFSGSHGITETVGRIARADGKDPYIVFEWGEVSEEGRTNQIVTDPSNTFYMTELPDGENWDISVMQAFSSRPTSVLSGDIPRFHAAVELVHDHVISISPDVEGILYETWARPVYNTNPPPYDLPYSASYTQELMQLELHTNYLKAAEDIVARGGKGRLAPVGQAWKATDWDLSLYYNYHQNARGALLNAMVIYRTIYFEKVYDIDPFYPEIQEYLSDNDLSVESWYELAAVADAVEISAPVDQPGNLLLVSTNTPVDEESGPVLVEVQRMGGSSGAVSVDWFTADATALAGQDYAASSGTLYWADGDWSNQTISIPILNDGNTEGDEEYFTIHLTNAAGGAGLWTPAAGRITIDDDETLSYGEITLLSELFQAGENSGATEITMRRENGKDGAVSVVCSATALTAQDGVDFVATNAVISWASKELGEKTLSVQLFDDDDENQPVTVGIALSNFTGNVSPGTITQAVLQILNDDFTPVSLGKYLFTGAGAGGDERTPHDEGNADSHLSFTPFLFGTNDLMSVSTDDELGTTGWTYDGDDARYVSFTVTPVYVDTHALTYTSIEADLVRSNHTLASGKIYDSAPKKLAVKLVFLGTTLHESPEYELTGHLETNHIVFDFEDVYATYEAIEFRFYATENVEEDHALYFDNIELFGAVSSLDPDDSDGDGLPDDWETTYFGDLSANPGDPAANGINTVQETYIAGLNPTNAASVFCINQLDLDSDTQLEWSPGVSGRVYSVYWTSNLLSGFFPLASNLPWTANAFTDTTHNAYDEGFYRVEVDIKP